MWSFALLLLVGLLAGCKGKLLNEEKTEFDALKVRDIEDGEYSIVSTGTVRIRGTDAVLLTVQYSASPIQRTVVLYRSTRRMLRFWP